jgi:V/A-type H+-transporting ATPase subunit B
VVADQLYALYARGRDLRRLIAVIGEAALSASERRVLDFADRFEGELIAQGPRRRSLAETFDVAWRLLAMLPRDELTRLPEDVIDRCWRPGGMAAEPPT